MEDEGKVRLGSGRQDTRRGKAFIIDQRRVLRSYPRDGVGWVRHDSIEGLLLEMLGSEERIPQLDIKVVVIDPVEEHVHTRQIVGRQVDLLPVEAVLYPILLEETTGLQEERARATRGVIDLITRACPWRASSAMSLETCEGVKNSPPDFPALAA